MSSLRTGGILTVDLHPLPDRMTEELETKGNQTRKVLPVDRGYLTQRDEQNDVNRAKHDKINE